MGIPYLFKPNVKKLKAKKDVEKLINALKYKDENVRMNALEALVMIGMPAVTPLIRTIGDSQYFQEHQYIRSYAIWALGKIGNAKAIKPLIQALNDMDPNVRINAACALGMIGRAIAIKPLIQALETDSYVEKNASWALGQIGEQAVEPLVQVMIRHNSDSVHETARKTLVKIGWEPKDDIERAYSLITKGQWSNYPWSELIKIGEPAVEPVNRILRESHYNETRIKAVKALGSIGNTRAIECLVLGLDDSDYRVTKTIVETLKEMGELAVEPLINDLNNRVYARYSVLKNFTMEFAHISDIIINEIEVLGSIGDKRAVEPLIGALKDKENSVRINAAKALEEIGWQPKDDIERAYYLVMSSPLNALELGKAAVEPLICLLEDVGYQRNAVEFLGKIGDKRAVEPLIQTLKYDDPYLVSYAVEALGKIGDVRAVKPLLLASERTFGRYDVAVALAEIGKAAAVEPLIQSLKVDENTSHSGMDNVVQALRYIGKPTVKPLTNALKDGDEYNRCYVEKALEEVKNEIK